MEEWKQFLKFFGAFIGALACAVALVISMWLGGAWLYGQSKVIVARFAAEAARIEAGH